MMARGRSLGHPVRSINKYGKNFIIPYLAGEEVENHLTEPIKNFDYINKITGDKILPKVLFFRAEDLPALGYKVYKFEKVSSVSKAVKEEVLSVDQMGFGVIIKTLNGQPHYLCRC